MGHVVTFHFHSFSVNQEKSIHLIKQNHIIVEINVGKNKYSKP